jgi:hypothetical protein
LKAQVGVGIGIDRLMFGTRARGVKQSNCCDPDSDTDPDSNLFITNPASRIPDPVSTPHPASRKLAVNLEPSLFPI